MIDDLSKASGETVHLGVLDGLQAVSIEGVESDRSLRISVPIGKRIFLHSTGIGKAILAFLPDEEIDRIIDGVGLPRFTPNTIAERTAVLNGIQAIRQSGYTVDNEQGVRCVASPIFDADKRVVASISISGPAMRIPKERIPQLVNFAPHLAIDIYKAAAGRDFSTLTSLVDKIAPFYDFLTRCAQRRSPVPAVLSPSLPVGELPLYQSVTKAAMSLVGLPGGRVREPMENISDAEREELRGVLKSIGII